MTYIIAQPCIGTKDASCVEVCPVDCIYEAGDMYFIHPDECIDCALCEPECPVDAIFADDEIPEGQEKFLELNRELSQIWPVITVAPTPPEDADDWRDVKDKLKYLER